MKAGTVVNLAEAEAAIAQAVDLAERTAKVQIESVRRVGFVRPARQRTVRRVGRLFGSTVADADIARVLAAGSRHSVRQGRAVLHSLPIGYALDETHGIRDPRGMLGQRFGVDMHVVTADVAAMRNLMLAVERCHLTVEAMVASPYVAGLAVLADDEADLGDRRRRYGRRHDDDRGLQRRPLRSCRRLCARWPPRHHGSRARAQCPHRRHRANQDVLWQCDGGASDDRE